MRLKKTVVMVGMMGAGKTAVGTALARVLGVPFLASDEEIVRAADRSIAEIFERDGGPFFRGRRTEGPGRPAYPCRGSAACRHGPQPGRRRSPNRDRGWPVR